MEWALILSLAAAGVNIVAIIVAVFRLGRAVERFEQIGGQQSAEIGELKNTVKSIGELIVKLALQNQRLDAHSTRIAGLERLVDDLRRGEGYIKAAGQQ